MISTNIGQFSLTDKQVRNFIPSGIWKRFSYINGEVIGVSDVQPIQTDIDFLISLLAALPDQEPQWEVDAKNQKKSRKRQLLDALATLTGLTRKQVLKCFVEIVNDLSDD